VSNDDSSVSFSYTVTDGALTAAGSATLDITPVNDAPTTTPVTLAAIAEDSGARLITQAELLSNANDVDGDALTAMGLSISAGAGALVDNFDGTWSYTPALNDDSSVSFSYTVTDGALTAAGSATLDITPVGDPAVIGGMDTGNVTEDDDPDMDNLLEVSGSLTIIDPDAGEAVFNSGVIGGTYGVITLNAAGDWDYAANNNQAAIQNLAAGATLTDTITVSSVDGTTHDIVITIMGTNDAPVAGNDVANVNEGGTVIIDVAATDSDIDDAIDLNSVVITGLPAYGTVVVNGDGTVTYTHDGSETLVDSFTYTISDISGAASNSATVTVSINPVNDPPIAGNDTATVAEGNSTLIDLAANDSDVDNALDLNSISIIGAPANGTLVVNGDGTVTYNHDGSETLSDSFTYTISDISGAISNTATVNITVTPVNDAPTTSGIADVTVNEDAAATTIDLHAAFNDADNLDSELTYSIVGNTNIGLFSLAGINGTTGQLSLGYAADMNGSAQITIRAADPSGMSVDTLFTVTVTPVNDAPVIQANNGMVATGAVPGTITSSDLNVTDVDNTSSEITYTLTVLPGNGQLLLNGVAIAVNDTFTQDDLDNNRVVYQAAGTMPADQFGFTVTDSAGGTLANNTFDIIVQLAQDNDAGTNAETVLPPADAEEEQIQDEILEDSGGTNDGSDGYGGGYVPFGSTSTPKPQPKPLPVLAIEPTSVPGQKPVQSVVKEVKEVNVAEVKTFTAVQLKSMDALWSAIDKMKQEMGGSTGDEMSPTEFKVAAAKSSGVVLTAGVVAWILRSGALLSSLMSTIPLWKGYDPLPILAYKDDEEKKEEDEIHEDKIPTSLEELQKLKKLKEKKSVQVDVDSIFDGSAIRE
jgi:VCBS repeat-containing protein